VALKQLLCFAFMASVGSIAYAGWESIGPFGGPLSEIVVAPSDDNIVYVASSDLMGNHETIICRSSDGAATWTRKGIIPNIVLSLAVDHSDPDILYAGSDVCVYNSTDGGDTWIAHAVPGFDIYGLTTHPVSSNMIFAAGKTQSASYRVMAFFVSTNSGIDWTALPLHTVYNGGAQALALDPSDPDIIYVGGSYIDSQSRSKVYKSTDGGSSFLDKSNGFSASANAINALRVHPMDPDIVYATTFYQGIYRSVNSGDDWSLVYTDAFFSCLATNQSEPDVVYAGKDTLVYKSTDQGANWFVPGTGYAGMRKLSRDIATPQNQAAIVYTADNSGVYKTTNGGADWLASNQGMTLAPIITFAHAPTLPATIYTEFEHVGVLKSTNCGVDWTLLPTPADCGAICGFAIHNSNPDVVYALEAEG
jgi:photosystem II stability/assembly factor-like uncharacterized protein